MKSFLLSLRKKLLRKKNLKICCFMFQELLNKQSQINPSASYFNIDILKYQVASLPGAASCPFQVGSTVRK
jgi:hypothetical protein